MSMLLMVQAMGLKVGNPLRKLVLLKLADNASDNGECWPSYGHIAEQCEIDRRSVIRHCKALAEEGYLQIENRPGEKGNSTNVFYLNLSASSKTGVTESHPPSDRVSLPQCHRVPPLVTQSHPEPVIEPVIEPKELIGASNTQKSSVKKSTAKKLSELDFGRWPAVPSAQVLSDWIAVRKGKKAPLTQTAVDRMVGDLTKAAAAGMSVDDCLSLCCVKGWVGFEFAWAVNCGAVVRAGAVGQPARHQPGPVSQHSSGEDDFADLGQAWGNSPGGFDGEGE